MANEAEIKAFQEAVLDALTGMSVDVADLANSHDEVLTRKGAQDVWDRLKARDFKVARAE